MQSDSEAAAEKCNINRIGSPWRVRMFHRSWFQVNPCTELQQRSGRARQRFLTCPTCANVRIKWRARVGPATRRLQQRGGEVGDC
jgi:hypothetical protein